MKSAFAQRENRDSDLAVGVLDFSDTAVNSRPSEAWRTMSYLIDELAKALAQPMPRRKMMLAFGRVLGGTALGTLFIGSTQAFALSCGVNNNVTSTGITSGGCPQTTCTSGCA